MSDLIDKTPADLNEREESLIEVIKRAIEELNNAEEEAEYALENSKSSWYIASSLLNALSILEAADV